MKAATKSSSRKASRKTTKKTTHRASATVRRKAVVKRVSSAAKKVKKKVKKGTKKSVKKNKLANTNTYNMYYRSGSKLATGKEASYDSMVNNMAKDPNGFEMAIYTLPIDVAMGVVGKINTIQRTENVYHGISKIIRGTKRAPKVGQPNSLYVQMREKMVVSRTKYNHLGLREYRDDFKHDHFIKELGEYTRPHRHVYTFNEKGQLVSEKVEKLLK